MTWLTGGAPLILIFVSLNNIAIFSFVAFFKKNQNILHGEIMQQKISKHVSSKAENISSKEFDVVQSADLVQASILLDSASIGTDDVKLCEELVRFSFN